MAEKKLLDQVRDVICNRHYSYKTEKSYVRWFPGGKKLWPAFCTAQASASWNACGCA